MCKSCTGVMHASEQTKHFRRSAGSGEFHFLTMAVDFASPSTGSKLAVIGAVVSEQLIQTYLLSL